MGFPPRFWGHETLSSYAFYVDDAAANSARKCCPSWEPATTLNPPMEEPCSNQPTKFGSHGK
jgi:hypothetical protein